MLNICPVDGQGIGASLAGSSNQARHSPEVAHSMPTPFLLFLREAQHSRHKRKHISAVATLNIRHQQLHHNMSVLRPCKTIIPRPVSSAICQFRPHSRALQARQKHGRPPHTPGVHLIRRPVGQLRPVRDHGRPMAGRSPCSPSASAVPPHSATRDARCEIHHNLPRKAAIQRAGQAGSGGENKEMVGETALKAANPYHPVHSLTVVPRTSIASSASRLQPCAITSPS